MGAGLLSVLAVDVPVLPSGGEARHLAAEELAKQVYENAKPALVEIIWNWLTRFFSDFLDGLNGLNANLGLVLLLALLLALIFLAVWLGRPRLNRSLAGSAEVFADSVPLTSAEHRRLAAAAAANADYAGAIAAQFRALVRRCEERAVIEPQPGRTAREVTEELIHAFGALAAPLQEAASLFNAVRYGRTFPSRQNFEWLSTLDKDISDSVPEYRDHRAAVSSPQ